MLVPAETEIKYFTQNKNEKRKRECFPKYASSFLKIIIIIKTTTTTYEVIIIT